MTRALIIGGGILRTAHAMEALGRGLDVIQFKVSAKPQASIPRSPGVLRFSRCAPDLELRLGLAAARAWRALAERIGRRIVRDVGSITDATGRTHGGDLVVLCPRARSDLTVSVLHQPPILRTIRLQLAQTECFEGNLVAPLSDLAALGQSGIGRSEGISGRVD